MDNPAFPAQLPPGGFRIHGIYGRVLLDGKGLIANDPATHPDRVGTPKGHPPLNAFLGVPLIMAGRTIGMIGLGNREGGYRQVDLEAAEALAPAILQALLSKRTGETLRRSEERFRQFATASSDALWIRDATTLKMEFLSPAFEEIYGAPRDQVMGDVRRWATLIVPDDREAALQRLEAVRQGEPAVHEFRIKRPSDGSFRWIRNADFPLFDPNGQVERIAGIATDVTEAMEATEHQAVLVAELQHRVRNIMAVIRSVVARSAGTAASVQQYVELLSGRLMALARTQALLTRGANLGVDVGAMIRDELAAQAHHEDQYQISGPELVISPKAAEVLSLAVHELAVNALKHGALASREGRVSVAWRVIARGAGAPWFGLTWRETRPQCADWSPATRRGFGSTLIEQRVPHELGGRGKLEISPRGAVAFIEFPLQPGASILETDAPLRTSVFGGSLDMTGEPTLAGQRVLVVEDDFYLADDAATVLRAAGAEVVGPFGAEAPAIAAARADRLSAAVVDINLGSGQSFEVARVLRTAGVPFVFLTGYDSAVIPSEFEGLPMLQKPVELRRIVRAVAALTDSPPA
jgi:PAS domain S-box-containing protein